MLEDARVWVIHFEGWYNTAHRHSGLNFVTSEYRHSAQAEQIMQQRIEVYEMARARTPQRWSGRIRGWTLPESVWLNPGKAAASRLRSHERNSGNYLENRRY